VLVIALVRQFTDSETSPFPDAVLIQRREEIDAFLNAIERDPGRWAEVMRSDSSENDRDFGPFPELEIRDDAYSSQDDREGLLRRRVTAMRAHVADAAARAHALRRQALLAAPLDRDRARRFLATLIAAHGESRFLGDLLGAIGDRTSSSAETSQTGAGDRVFISRDGFVLQAYPDDVLLRLAANLGPQLGQAAEVNQIYAALRSSERAITQGDVYPTAKEATDRLRTLGFVPSVIIAPGNWRLTRELTGRFGAIDLPDGVLAGLPRWYRRRYRGQLKGTDVPVVSPLGWPENDVLVMDARAALRVVDFDAESGDAAHAALRSATEEVLVPPVGNEVTTEPDALESAPPDRVALELAFRWRIEAKNLEAAVWITVPADLQENP
jgi:hypothetical protein